ncbi:MAG: hypothetical protein OXE40_00210, partial [Gammaproteobacteria bacterium]|nr:hypothetical protein [Gammaproteobacteria bacterium]
LLHLHLAVGEGADIPGLPIVVLSSCRGETAELVAADVLVRVLIVGPIAPQCNDGIEADETQTRAD